MSFRNRCLIAGAQGIISLSVPLQQGRNQQLPMNEVRISDTEQWQSRHFKSIRSTYNRSPFFDFYQDELAAIYRRPFELLTDWNICCLEWVKEKLAWRSEILFTESAVPYQRDGIKGLRDGISVPHEGITEPRDAISEPRDGISELPDDTAELRGGITDLRNRVQPKNYMEWKPVKYRQVFEERTGFFPNLSVLDLLFNTGPEAAELLRSST